MVSVIFCVLSLFFQVLFFFFDILFPAFFLQSSFASTFFSLLFIWPGTFHFFVSVNLLLSSVTATSSAYSEPDNGARREKNEAVINVLGFSVSEKPGSTERQHVLWFTLWKPCLNSFISIHINAFTIFQPRPKPWTNNLAQQPDWFQV